MEILDDYETPENIKKFEKTYFEGLKNSTLTAQDTFIYAWGLTRSKYKSDIKRGIDLLEELCITGDPNAKRDYLLYLSVANFKLGEYNRANECIDKFLSVEPNNRQALQIKNIIKDSVTKAGLKGAAIAGTAALVFGGLIGLGMAIASKHR